MILLTSTACDSPFDSSVDLAAPAEPHSVAIFERGFHRDRHSAGERRAWGIGNRDAVRDYDKSRAHASSQLDDSRVAVLMMPAME